MFDSLVRGKKDESDIFTFAMLLSSLLVVNSLNTIERTLLEQMSFVVEVVKRVRVGAEVRVICCSCFAPLLLLPVLVWCCHCHSWSVADDRNLERPRRRRTSRQPAR